MAMIRTTRAQCDDCHQQSEYTDPSSTDLKKVLRQEGWRFRNGHHRCPACTTTQPAVSE